MFKAIGTTVLRSISKMKLTLPLLLSLTASTHAFANEALAPPHEKLQNIIEQLQTDSRQEALNQLSRDESDLITSVNKAQNAEAYMLLGRAYFYAEMDSKATEALNFALQLDPHQTDAHFIIGRIHGYADDIDAAIDSFRKAIAINGEEETYFLELGRMLEMKDDQTSAITAYKSVLALNKENFDANFYLAAIHAVKGNTASAENHFLAALEQNPKDLASHYNLGQLYQNEKRHILAIERFEKVAQLDPNDWRAIQKLVQENEAINDRPSRDLAIEAIYNFWRTNADDELRQQEFYIREQKELENGKLYVLEYFELKGERARKFVFKLRNEQTEEFLFEVSLGSYDSTTDISRSLGEIGPDDRVYHLDGYAPNGTHYTYAFFNSLPTYDDVKKLALEALTGEKLSISNSAPSNE